jgi:hypothetical protein
MTERLETALHGAVAGVIAAGTMTFVRLLARRGGMIDTMVPQAVEQWARQEIGAGTHNPGTHTAADQALHLAYGAIWGAGYGLCAGRRRAIPKPATVLGVAQWIVGPTILLPALGIAPAPWRTSTAELAINLAAHALYAGITAFVTDEFSRQARDPRRRRPELRWAAKIG